MTLHARSLSLSQASFATTVFASLALLGFGTSLAAQTPSRPMIQGDNAAARMEQERQHLAADQRQQKMLQDADMLLHMAQQLKLNVDKTDKYTLSVEVVKEAERIEKLAREVKDNMRH